MQLQFNFITEKKIIIRNFARGVEGLFCEV